MRKMRLEEMKNKYEKNNNKGDDDVGQVTKVFKSAMNDLYPFAKEERQKLLDDLKVAQHIYDRDPTDAHNLKNWATTLIRLSFKRPFEKNHRKIEQWLRDAKSKLEEALKFDDKDYETKFKLGKVHYHLLQNDTSLRGHHDVYLKLCHDARDLFKEVQEKAPSVYNDSMLEKIEAFFPFDWQKLRDEIEDEELGGEQGGEDMNANEKEDMIEQMLVESDEKLGGEQGGEDMNQNKKWDMIEHMLQSGEAFRRKYPNGSRNYDQEYKKYKELYEEIRSLKKLLDENETARRKAHLRKEDR